MAPEVSKLPHIGNDPRHMYTAILEQFVCLSFERTRIFFVINPYSIYFRMVITLAGPPAFRAGAEQPEEVRLLPGAES